MDNNKQTINLSARSFIAAILVIFLLMVGAYILTLTIPGGIYPRTEDAAGNLIIDTAAGFSFTQGGIPFWKWILSLFWCWVLPETERSSPSSRSCWSSAVSLTVSTSAA